MILEAVSSVQHFVFLFWRCFVFFEDRTLGCEICVGETVAAAAAAAMTADQAGRNSWDPFALSAALLGCSCNFCETKLFTPVEGPACHSMVTILPRFPLLDSFSCKICVLGETAAAMTADHGSLGENRLALPTQALRNMLVTEGLNFSSCHLGYLDTN